MTIEIATALFLGMALQSAMNDLVNDGKPVRRGEAYTKAIVFVVVTANGNHEQFLAGRI